MLPPIFNRGGEGNLSYSLSLSLFTTGGSVWEVVFKSVVISHSLSLSFFLFFSPVLNKEKDGKTNKKERVRER